MRSEVLALFAACFLMTMAHGPYYTFYSIHLAEHDYSKATIGGLWALGVICEIAVFLALPRLVGRFSLPAVLAFSLACAVLNDWLNNRAARVLQSLNASPLYQVVSPWLVWYFQTFWNAA